MKVLLVTRHFPPGGGGGVQRPLKFATHLPALGIETHVLAPDVAGAVPDDELELPTQAWIHRVRYVGPRAARPSEELVGKQGIARVGTQAAPPPPPGSGVVVIVGGEEPQPIGPRSLT